MSPLTSTIVYASISGRLVQQVFDVESGVGETGRDLTDHVRHVRIGNRDSMTAVARQPALGEIHREANVAVFEVVLKVLGDHDRAIGFCLGRRCAEVRQRYGLGVSYQFAGREVRDVGVQLAAESSAAIAASSSTTCRHARRLISVAPSFSSARRSLLTMPRVASISGTWQLIASAC